MNQKLYKNYADDIAQYLRQGKKTISTNHLVQVN